MKLRSREPDHVVGEIGQRLDANCRLQQYKKYTRCVQGAVGERTWSSRQRRCDQCHGVLCVGFPARVSGIAMASSIAGAFRRASSEDGLELPGRQEEGPPLLQVHHFGPQMGETSETGLFILGPFVPSLLCGEGMVLIKVLGFPNLSINVLLQKDVLGNLVLHPPV